MRWFVLIPAAGCAAEMDMGSAESADLTGDSPIYFGDSGLFDDSDFQPEDEGGGAGEALPSTLGSVQTEPSAETVTRGLLAHADSSGIHVEHFGVQAPCEQDWSPAATVSDYIIHVEYSIGTGDLCLHTIGYTLSPGGLGLSPAVYLLRAGEDQVSVDISAALSD